MSHRPHIFAVINQKGGVSKTTTTANLGVLFAQRGYKTLLLDLDPQGSLSALHDAQNARSLASVENLTVWNLATLGAQNEATNSSLDFSFLLDAQNAANAQNASERFDVVFFDCPPTLGPTHREALRVADLALAPMPPKFLDAHGFAQLRQTVELTQNAGNARLQLKVLIALRDNRQSAHRQFEAAFRQALGNQLFETAIPYAAVFDRATLLGTTAVQLEPRSNGAQAYAALAQEIESLMQLKPQQKPKSEAKSHGAPTKSKK